MSPINFIDPTSTEAIGEGTVVWHFAVILANVRIGRNCSIGSHAEIGRGTVIGNETRIGSGVFLPSNSVIEDRVFIGPGAVFCDDRDPRAGNSQYEAKPPYIESGASVGAGCVVLPGVRLGAGCMIGAGAIVTRDVKPHEHVRGEPARVKPYSRVHTEMHYDIYAPSIRPQPQGEPSC